MNSISDKTDDENSEEDISEAIKELGFQIAVDNPEWQVEYAKGKANKSGKKNIRQVKKNITSLGQSKVIRILKLHIQNTNEYFLMNLKV